uniref:Acyltransferase 3 n=1 Tax=Sphingobacterium sp. (strain 21) TaxID=743722 RepID=F4C958_SPHS2
MKERNYAIDTLRTVATVYVILIHVVSTHIKDCISNNSFAWEFWFANIIDSFCRICVPIFVMISGQFLLGKDDTFVDFYKNRTRKILVPLIFWSFFYSIYTLLVRYISSGIWDFSLILNNLVYGKPYFHLWYVFMLLGLYLVTPLINRCLRITFKQPSYVWGIGVSLLILGICLGLYYHFYGHTKFFIVWFLEYLGYYILGYAISRYKVLKNTRWLLVVYGVSSAAIALMTYYAIKAGWGLYFYSYSSPLVIIGTICVYFYFTERSISANYFSKLAGLTFGVYLIHAFVLTVLNKVLTIGLLEISAFIAIPLKLIVVFFISAFIAYTLSRHSLLRRII